MAYTTGDIILDAAGSNVTLKAGGTSRFDFLLDATPQLKAEGGTFDVQNQTSDADLRIRGNDGGVIITAVTFDMSAAGAATFNSSVTSTKGVFTQTAGDFAAVFTTPFDYVAKFISTDSAGFIVLQDSNSTDNANRIGAMIMHLAATEVYYQVFTIENRGYNAEEKEMWETAMNLGHVGREELVDKPISYYLEIWDDVRKETKRLLKTKDDKWFKNKAGETNMNNHWAWYHVMEHQANHMGQLALITKRL